MLTLNRCARYSLKSPITLLSFFFCGDMFRTAQLSGSPTVANERGSKCSPESMSSVEMLSCLNLEENSQLESSLQSKGTVGNSVVPKVC